ncbi:hypothetical protein [Microbacterium hydrocarbonoxydans]|uniref:hypothetical protein n=1 Tax=Microbacterium hydrocarbonoxydans TaxID=273678 RepID=UPI0007BB95AD|nr:hypothetical protein [Microbacterium hydrocarbonoxydans]GAT73735.1 hypothetical protein MHM582_2229 [Microbacterium sp. HM58-2]
MMYGTGFGWGWMWVGGVLMLLILIALVVLIVRLSAPGATLGPRTRESGAADQARRIAAERMARGEIAPDEFHRIVGALDEHR